MGRCARSFAAAAGFLILLAAPVAQAVSVLFYTDEALWTSNVAAIELFETEAVQIAQSNEIASPPGNNAHLGTPLTFLSANTGLSRDFRLNALQPLPGQSQEGFTFNDTERGPIYLTGTLSPGDIDDGEDDDVEWEILSGPALLGFAFDLVDNAQQASPPEFLSVYGTSGLLATTSAVPSGAGGEFFGVISDVPIVRIVFDEDATTGDDIAIRDFRFAAPEPGSALLLGLGLAGLAILRRRAP